MICTCLSALGQVHYYLKWNVYKYTVLCVKPWSLVINRIILCEFSISYHLHYSGMLYRYKTCNLNKINWALTGKCGYNELNPIFPLLLSIANMMYPFRVFDSVVRCVVVHVQYNIHFYIMKITQQISMDLNPWSHRWIPTVHACQNKYCFSVIYDAVSVSKVFDFSDRWIRFSLLLNYFSHRWIRF